MKFPPVEKIFKLTRGNVSHSEVKKLFEFRPGRYLPCGLNMFDKIWWRCVPGTVINVKWPTGWAVLYEDGHGGQTAVESADPNDHYRPWLEKNVGRQGWDWNWGMAGNDVSENRLTIKIRRKYDRWATLAAIKWG